MFCPHCGEKQMEPAARCCRCGGSLPRCGPPGGAKPAGAPRAAGVLSGSALLGWLLQKKR